MSEQWIVKQMRQSPLVFGPVGSFYVRDTGTAEALAQLLNRLTPAGSHHNTSTSVRELEWVEVGKHAEQLAYLEATGQIPTSDAFIEGYGPIKEMGISVWPKAVDTEAL